MVNVPGAAPPAASESVFGGGWLGTLLGGGKEILTAVQQHELAKMTAKANAAALAAPANYQTVPTGASYYGQGSGYLPAGGIGGVSYEVLLLVGGAALVGIYLLRR
ncbi:MAG: hypothetical protein WCY02_01745 [Parvibaculum sp.]